MVEPVRVLALSAMLMASALLASCASDLKKAQGELGEIKVWLAGVYDNAPGQGEQEPLTLYVLQVYMPTFGDNVFYLQENATNDPGRITAQRLLSFQAVKDGHVVETVYTLAQPGRWRDGHLNPDLFKGLMYKDATPVAGCDLMWKKEGTKFVGKNPNGGCNTAMSSLGGTERVQASMELTPQELALGEVYRYKKRTGL